MLDKAKEKGCEVTLPIDWLCGQEFKNDQEMALKDVVSCPKGTGRAPFSLNS